MPWADGLRGLKVEYVAFRNRVSHMSGVHWCYGGGLSNDLGRSGLERKGTLPPPCEMTTRWTLELAHFLPPSEDS